MKSLFFASVLALSSVALSTSAGASTSCADLFSKKTSPASAISTDEKVAKAKFKTKGEEQTLSQAIRSNVSHYWSYVAKLKASTPLRAYEKYQGIVTGDPHLGNFSIIPVVGDGGRRSLQFVDIDFDDAGLGPFAFDFARFVLTVKATDPDLHVKDLTAAYMRGLYGKEDRAPEKIRELLSMTMAEFDEKNAEYIEKKKDGDAFKLKDGKLETYSAKYSRKSIEALFAGETVLDIATRPEDRGGSVGAVRLWVLVKSRGVTRIEEIKGYETPGIAKYHEQPSTKMLVSMVQGTLWDGLRPDGYELKKLEGDYVWVRAKKLTLVDIPYGIKDAKAQKFVDELSLFDANYLGLLHGQQLSSHAYVRAIEKDPDQFREAVKALSKDYLERAQAKMK